MGYNFNLNGDEINCFGQESDRTRVDTWHDMGRISNLNLSWDKRGIRAKKSPFFIVLIERERRAKASSRDLQSFVGLFSSGQERKFIASTRGTRGYLERGISPKIQKRRFREIEDVGFGRLPTHVSHS